MVCGSRYEVCLFSYEHSSRPLHIPRFVVGKSHYQFQVLPFAIATAFRVFIKMFAIVAAYICHLGQSRFPYLEEWLLVAPSRTRLLATIRTLCALLGELGICSNKEKSVLNPTHNLIFIWARLDSVMARAFLPSDHFAPLIALIVRLCRQPCMLISQ